MASSSSNTSLAPRTVAAADAAVPKPPQLNEVQQFQVDHPEAGKQLAPGTRVYAKFKGYYYAAIVYPSRTKSNQHYNVVFTDDVPAVVARNEMFLLSEVALGKTATIWSTDGEDKVIVATPSKQSAENWLAANFTVVDSGTKERENAHSKELCFDENHAASRAIGQGAGKVNSGPRARRAAKRYSPMRDNEDGTEKSAETKGRVKRDRKRRLDEENEAGAAGPSTAVREQARGAQPSAQRPVEQQSIAQHADAHQPVAQPPGDNVDHGEALAARGAVKVEKDANTLQLAQLLGQPTAAQPQEAEHQDAQLLGVNLRSPLPAVQQREEQQPEYQQPEVKIRVAQRVAQADHARAKDDDDDLQILSHKPPAKRRRNNEEVGLNRPAPGVTDYGAVITRGNGDNVFYRSRLLTDHHLEFSPIPGVFGARRMYSCVKCREVEPSYPTVIVENGRFVERDPDCPMNRTHVCLPVGIRKNDVHA